MPSSGFPFMRVYVSVDRSMGLGCSTLGLESACEKDPRAVQKILRKLALALGINRLLGS